MSPVVLNKINVTMTELRNLNLNYFEIMNCTMTFTRLEEGIEFRDQ